MLYGAPLDEKKLQRLREAIGFLNVMLEKQEWCACDHFTIADLILCITVGQIQACDIEIASFGNVLAWLERCKLELQPYGYEVCSILIGVYTLTGTFTYRKLLNRLPSLLAVISALN